jgi:hypothetical protein
VGVLSSSAARPPKGRVVCALTHVPAGQSISAGLSAPPASGNRAVLAADVASSPGRPAPPRLAAGAGLDGQNLRTSLPGRRDLLCEPLASDVNVVGIDVAANELSPVSISSRVMAMAVNWVEPLTMFLMMCENSGDSDWGVLP